MSASTSVTFYPLHTLAFNAEGTPIWVSRLRSRMMDFRHALVPSGGMFGSWGALPYPSSSDPSLPSSFCMYVRTLLYKETACVAKLIPQSSVAWAGQVPP